MPATSFPLTGFLQLAMSRRSLRRERRECLRPMDSSGRWCVLLLPHIFYLLHVISQEIGKTYTQGTDRYGRPVMFVGSPIMHNALSLTTPCFFSYVHVAKHRTFDQVRSIRLIRARRTDFDAQTVAQGPRGLCYLPDGVEPVPVCASRRQDCHGELSRPILFRIRELTKRCRSST